MRALTSTKLNMNTVYCWRRIMRKKRDFYPEESRGITLLTVDWVLISSHTTHSSKDEKHTPEQAIAVNYSF